MSATGRVVDLRRRWRAWPAEVCGVSVQCRKGDEVSVTALGGMLVPVRVPVSARAAQSDLSLQWGSRPQGALQID
jgi:hypothetical protein